MAEPIKKEDAARTFEIKNAPKIEELVNLVNEKIRSNYNPDSEYPMTVSVSLFSYPVIARVVEIFKAAEWEISFQDDQHDGAFLNIK